jgi:DNA polymerase gamma 1
MRSRCAHHVVHAYERTQQTSLLRIRVAPKWSCAQARQYATTAVATIEEPDHATAPSSSSLAVPSEARYNDIGVQHVSSHVHKQLFPPLRHGNESRMVDPELIDLSKRHLATHDLLGKTSDQTPPIGFDLPPLQGSSLDEHFHRLGLDSADSYLQLAKRYARASPPPKPRRWEKRSGWTKYHGDGTCEAVPFPDADVLTFDTEVIWHQTNFPAMACAVSADHWYAWLSPWLLGESSDDKHLIPLGDPSRERIVVGHNVGYDRARIEEEYDLRQSKNFFVDTMSLHVAVNGMCSRQRPSWTRARKAREFNDKVSKDEQYGELGPLLDGPDGVDDEEELWVGRSASNSLRDVAKFHCNIVLDKSQRDLFSELEREGILEKWEDLLTYCAADVEVTHKVYKRVFPTFLETCPHPVSFAALRHLATEILPVDKGWEEYIGNAEATYQRLTKSVEKRLAQLAEQTLEHKQSPDVYDNDPWLRQLDWSGQEIRYLKPKRKGEEPRIAAKQKKPGMPIWYKDLFKTAAATDMSLTVRTRIAPLLLRLAWDGHPLVWSDKHGWTFRVLPSEAPEYRHGMTEADMEEEANPVLRNDFRHVYFKLPHPDGPAARCATPIAKGYLQYMESGILGSEYEYAKECLEMNASCSYWISARDRIRHQMVVYQDEYQRSQTSEIASRNSRDRGFIIPQVVPMGTITRRAVENTWLTASNAKKNRVGSELKSMVTAPPGYCFVGADVDSQELWIASLVGDASFKLHGGNAIGFMTLEGTKAAGTDLHSRTAQILGISRNDAKVFNYGRIYGAGLKFAQGLLKRFNPALSQEEAVAIGQKLYAETKGTKGGRKSIRASKFWYGGTESFVFNALEDFAGQEKPRTPVLGAGITEALMKRFLASSGSGGNNFLTSRINWAIQSSGVDYLHLLIVSMEYLCKRYNIEARLALTVHDEIRYLTKEEDKYRTAMALQVANVWTRAMFSQQMGIEDLPQSCAYFSAIDIDHVLRKEVDMDCVTPSHPKPIPAGESLDIVQLLEKGGKAFLDPSVEPVEKPEPGKYDYVPRVPVMKELGHGSDRAFIRAQIARTIKEVDGIGKEASRGAVRPFNDGPHVDRGAVKKSPVRKTPTSNKTPKPTGKKSPRALSASSAFRAPTTIMTQSPLKDMRSWSNLVDTDVPLDGLDHLAYPFTGYVDRYEDKTSGRMWASTAMHVGLAGGAGAAGRWSKQAAFSRH